jgi:putative lipoic acid-binding regulatory protein
LSTEPPDFLQLLKDHHEFPGPFVFKVIGRPADGFIARLLLAVREELNIETDPPFVLRQSSQGKYIAVTMEPYLMSAEEVLVVYRRLREVDGVVMYY